MRGLKKFRRRTLYANVVNDKSAVYYTTGIAKTDPYTNLDGIRPNYVAGYEDVILDPLNPWSPVAKSVEPRTIKGLGTDAVKWAKRAPLLVALAVFVPLGVVVFLGNSVYQSIRSSERIRLHEKGLAGIRVDDYRRVPPLLLADVRGAVEDAYEELNSSQVHEYLVQDGQESQDGDAEDLDDEEQEGLEILALERKKSRPAQPTLALSPQQFKMVEELDRVGWRKFPVFIHKVRHSHAAIIVRTEKPSFSEGWVVMKHWIEEEFLM